MFSKIRSLPLILVFALNSVLLPVPSLAIDLSASRSAPTRADQIFQRLANNDLSGPQAALELRALSPKEKDAVLRRFEDSARLMEGRLTAAIQLSERQHADGDVYIEGGNYLMAVGVGIAAVPLLLTALAAENLDIQLLDEGRYPAIAAAGTVIAVTGLYFYLHSGPGTPFRATMQQARRLRLQLSRMNLAIAVIRENR